MKRIRYSLLTIISSLVLFSSCSDDSPTQSQAPLQNDEFQFAWSFLEAFFVFQDSLPTDPTVFDSPKELYASVNEPYTVYYSPAEARTILNQLSSQAIGIGVLIDSTYDGFSIESVVPHSPADKVGLKKGDVLISVQGVDVAGLSFDALENLLSGESGDTKKIVVKRSAETLTVNVRIEPFVAPTVFADSIDTAIAYIRITGFFSSTIYPGGTATEFDSALGITSWAQATILDLRDNPGGEVEPAIQVISQFLPEGTPIVTTTERVLVSEDSDSATTVDSIWRSVDTSPEAVNRRFYVLINQNTASAAEILVAAIQRQDNIVSVGTETYGKARGQVISLTPDSGLVRVTYALISPVDAPKYDVVGISPEIQITGDNQLAETVDIAERSVAKRQVDLWNQVAFIARKTSSFTAMYKKPFLVKWVQ